jgi:hypothetical protein
MMLTCYTSLLPLFYPDLAKEAGSEVQSVLIPRSKYSLEEARRWVRSHNYSVTKPPDITRTYYRFRQKDPAQYARLRTKQLGSGIKLIVGWKA